MQEAQHDQVSNSGRSRSSQKTEKQDEDTLLAQRDPTNHKPAYFESTEQYWENPAGTTELVGVTQPLAKRKSWREPLSTLVIKDKAQIMGSEPERKRPRKPSRWDTQLDSGAATLLSESAITVGNRLRPPLPKPMAIDPSKDSALIESDEQVARRLQAQFRREAGIAITDPYSSGSRSTGSVSTAAMGWGGVPSFKGARIIDFNQSLAGARTQDARRFEGFHADQAATTMGACNRKPVSNSGLNQWQLAPGYVPKPSFHEQDLLGDLPFREICDRCSAMHFVCSKEKPSCEYCKQRGAVCTYSPGPFSKWRAAGAEDLYEKLCRINVNKLIGQSSGAMQPVDDPRPRKMVAVSDPKPRKIVSLRTQPRADDYGPDLAGKDG